MGHISIPGSAVTATLLGLPLFSNFACGGRSAGDRGDAGQDGAGHGSDGGSQGDGGGGPEALDRPLGADGKPTPPCAVDIIFMVDNSSSMTEEQTNLAKNFKSMLAVLDDLPSGRPDLHIGVVSSSLGAGMFTDVPGCPSDGDRGALQSAPRVTGCSPPSERYIASAEKGTKNNFSGDIGAAFACIASLGTGGCGFEHQLASLRRALDGTVPDNAGFLRSGADLAIVIITDEDDCSASPDANVFDTAQNSCSDSFGPLSSYRCTEFGVLCGTMPPPHCEAASSLPDCHSAEDDGELLSVKPMADFFKGLKSDPARVIATAIAGEPAPFSIVIGSVGQPELAPSCTSKNGKAAPAVRIKDFVGHFAEYGLFQSICSDDFGPAMTKIGELVRKRLATAGC